MSNPSSYKSGKASSYRKEVSVSDFDASWFSSEGGKERYEELKGHPFRKEIFCNFQGYYTSSGDYMQCELEYDSTCDVLWWKHYATRNSINFFPDIVYEFYANLLNAYVGLVKVQDIIIPGIS